MARSSSRSRPRSLDVARYPPLYGLACGMSEGTHASKASIAATLIVLKKSPELAVLAGLDPAARAGGGLCCDRAARAASLARSIIECTPSSTIGAIGATLSGAPAHTRPVTIKNCDPQYSSRPIESCLAVVVLP